MLPGLGVVQGLNREESHRGQLRIQSISAENLAHLIHILRRTLIGSLRALILHGDVHLNLSGIGSGLEFSVSANVNRVGLRRNGGMLLGNAFHPEDKNGRKNDGKFHGVPPAGDYGTEAQNPQNGFSGRTFTEPNLAGPKSLLTDSRRHCEPPASRTGNSPPISFLQGWLDSEPVGSAISCGAP